MFILRTVVEVYLNILDKQLFKIEFFILKLNFVLLE